MTMDRLSGSHVRLEKRLGEFSKTVVCPVTVSINSYLSIPEYCPGPNLILVHSCKYESVYSFQSSGNCKTWFKITTYFPFGDRKGGFLPQPSTSARILVDPRREM